VAGLFINHSSNIPIFQYSRSRDCIVYQRGGSGDDVVYVGFLLQEKDNYFDLKQVEKIFSAYLKRILIGGLYYF
jgi:hypothetical protein